MDNQQPNQALNKIILSKYKSGQKIEDIANELNVSVYRVYRPIEEDGDERRKKSILNKKIYDLKDKGLLIGDIAKELNLTPRQVQYRLSRKQELIDQFDLSVDETIYYNDVLKLVRMKRPFSEICDILDIEMNFLESIVYKANLLQYDTVLKTLIEKPELKDLFIHLYYDEKLTMTEIAKIVGFKRREDVGRSFIYFGIESTRHKRLTDDILYDEYIHNDLNHHQIAEKYGVHSWLVSQKIKELGIYIDLRMSNYSKLGQKMFSDSDYFIKYINENKLKLSLNELSTLIKCTKYRLIREFEKHELIYSDYLIVDTLSKLSKPELNFYNQLLNCNYNLTESQIVIQDRYVIKPFELDFYIPHLKLAFEINPSFTHRVVNEAHSQYRVSSHYHSMKKRLCEDAGIKLIHVWEHEIDNLQHLIKSISEITLYENKFIFIDKYSKSEVSSKFKILDHHDCYYLYKDKYCKQFDISIQPYNNFDKITQFLKDYTYVIQTSGVWEVQRL